MNIRVVRESGGLGDVIRVIPVLRGLREKHPGAKLWLFMPPEYKPLMAGWYDRFVPTPRERRRPRDSALDESKFPYLAVEGVTFDLSISLYCPAFRHEADSRGEVWFDRIDLMCQAAAVEPSTKTPRINLAPRDVLAAVKYQKKLGVDSRRPPARRLVMLQPFSTDPGRNWPVDSWIELADCLEAAGCRVLIMDGCKGRSKRFKQHRVLEQPIGLVAALVAFCDLLIGPDSGGCHLAAAVGTPGIGLFASQSGPLMFRHYPHHSYIYPPWDNQEHCRWPCFWARPRECMRDRFVAERRVCPMLERIAVAEVVDLAIAKLREGPRPIAEPIKVQPMTEEQAGYMGSVPSIWGLPISARDFALPSVAMAAGCDDLLAALREAYRVLRPDGVLYLPAAVQIHADLIRREGFSMSCNPCSLIATCLKCGTWPRPPSIIEDAACLTGCEIEEPNERALGSETQVEPPANGVPAPSTRTRSLEPSEMLP